MATGADKLTDTDKNQLYLFHDLQALQICKNRTQLKNMIEKYGFDPGFLLTPQKRAWFAYIVQGWLKSRPTATIEPRGRAKALKEGTAKPPRRNRDASQAAEASHQR